ncbi:MAG: S-layer family protein [Cyanobacteria bacterium P01_D01_bin.44]
MTRCQPNLIRQIQRGLGTILLGLAVTYPTSSQAQIASDSSVGTLVNACPNSLCIVGTCTVTGGTASGGNLFHSFSEFSPTSGSTALFQVAPDIANIITRVTGGQISTVDGMIQTGLTGDLTNPGTANLYLINPSGIVFGPGASLDIGGSFMASTAESIFWDNNVVWQTNDLSAAPRLLTVSAPIGLQLGATPGSIQVNGSGSGLYFNPNFSINRSTRNAGLAVPEGETLALVGGDLSLMGGNLTALGGRVELGSISGDGQVTWSPANHGWQLNYESIDTLGDITLTNAASVDASGPSSGDIHIQGQTVSLYDGSALVLETTGNGSGGLLRVAADTLIASGQSAMAPPTAPTGLPPNISLPSGLYADVATGQSGMGGSVLIEASKITFNDGAQATVATFGSGPGGDLTVRAEQIELIGGLPSGPSGFLTAVAPVFPIYGAEATQLIADGLELVALAPFIAVPQPASGDAGQLSVETNSLSLQAGAQIASTSFAVGNAGQLSVTADTIDISGGNPGGPSSIQASAQGLGRGSGNGNNLTIHTRRLQITDGGQIATGTLGTGNAGTVRVNATESIELSGESELGRSGLFSSALSVSDAPPVTDNAGNVIPGGNAGNVIVNTPELSLREGATISVGNFPSSDNPALAAGTGPGGNIDIIAQTIILDDQSQLNSETNHDAIDSGGANITLQADALVLRGSSSINANAQGSATGGNISIDAGTLIALDNSDITANAVDNFGGRVMVAAATIIGTQFREQLTSESDITASSALGPQFSGTVELTSPEIDPAQGITTLSETVASRDQVAAACSAGADNDFVASGRGGVPEDASQTLRGNSLWQDLRLADTIAQENALDVPAHEPPSYETTTALPEPIIEAQGVTMSADGKVSFLARPSGQQVANHQHHCLRG